MHGYAEDFYRQHREGAIRSARRLVPLIHSLFRPASVLDVGCGDGAWLSEWSQCGIDDYLGVDGAHVARLLRIPSDHFAAHDLARPLDLGRKFDLVSSLEVAEHIAPDSATTFVESLARHGSLVVFSAAVPGQFGECHVNEQWPSYWARLFEAVGMRPFDVLRPRIWTDPEIEWWYRQNILVFCAGDRAVEIPALMHEAGTLPLEVAHPDFVMHFKDSLRTDASVRLLALKILGLIRKRLGAAWRRRR